MLWLAVGNSKPKITVLLFCYLYIVVDVRFSSDLRDELNINSSWCLYNRFWLWHFDEWLILTYTLITWYSCSVTPAEWILGKVLPVAMMTVLVGWERRVRRPRWCGRVCKHSVGNESAYVHRRRNTRLVSCSCCRFASRKYWIPRYGVYRK